MIPPRGMSKEQAAAYAGCETLSAFNDWIRRGILPGPIPGTHKWDRIGKQSMQPLTGYPASSLQSNPSCHPTTNGRHRKMRVRLKGINSFTTRLADGAV